MNSVFFLNAQSEWHEFKKEGNVTDIVTIFPYQAWNVWPMLVNCNQCVVSPATTKFDLVCIQH